MNSAIKPREDAAMDPRLLDLLDELFHFGAANDERQTLRSACMYNVTPDTGRLLWTLVVSARATRILEVGTSNGYSTIWLADAARMNHGQVTTLESADAKIQAAKTNLERAGLSDTVRIVAGRA